MSPVVAQLIGGGAVAVISVIGTYYVNKNKVRSEADSGFADTYLKVSDKLNKDADRITAQFEKKIADIVAGYEDQLRRKDIIIGQQKDLIDDQNTRIGVLEGKVDELEKQVDLAKSIPKVVEEAREIGHHALDVLADRLNPDIPTE